MNYRRAASYVCFAFLACAAPLHAGPMYGSRVGTTADDVGHFCFQDGFDNFYFPSPGRLILTVFIDDLFAAVWQSLYTSPPSSPLTQDQAEGALKSAMEVWNNESRGPVLQWGGRISGIHPKIAPLTGAKRHYMGPDAADCEPLRALPEDSIYVYADTVDLGATSGLHASFSFGAIDDPQGNCSLDLASPIRRRGGIGVVYDSPASPGNGVRTVHNLKALFVHELGHGLGFSHTNGSDTFGLSGASGAISVMSEDSTWPNFFNETVPDAPGGFRPVPARSASPTGFYTQSAPYPEGLALSSTGALRMDETGNKMRLGRLNQLHLWPIDSDCVDDDLSVGSGANFTDKRRRRLQYWSAEYNTSTHTFRDVELAGPSTRRTSKGFRSGGSLRDATGASTYALYYDGLTDATNRASLVTPTAVNFDGSIAYTEVAEIQGTHITDPQLPVVLFSVFEKSLSSFNHVIWYARANTTDVSQNHDPNDDAALADPPVWRQQRGTSLGQLEGSQDVSFCLDVCDERLLQTHVPPSVTWDPRSQQTLFAIVPTRGNCQTDDSTTALTCGRIYVHPGYATSGANVNSTLRKGTMLDARFIGGAVRLPGYPGSGGYMYTGRTDVAPGIACAPPAAGAFASCILAWSDSGTPDGDILYTYFYVSGTTVQFGGDAFRLGRQTYSDISLAYFDNRFWIAYSNLQGNPVYKSTLPFDLLNWTGAGHSYLTHVAVEPPTWHYDPRNASREAAFVFAEYEAQNSGSTGTFELSPSSGTLPVHQRVSFQFTWSVPAPGIWRDLARLQLRIRDERDIVLWVRYDIASNSFAVRHDAKGKFEGELAPGTGRPLGTNAATFYPADSSVEPGGPDAPNVRLNLSIYFKPKAAGRTFDVEVAAEDNFGNVDDFVTAGVLTVRRGPGGGRQVVEDDSREDSRRGETESK